MSLRVVRVVALVVVATSSACGGKVASPDLSVAVSDAGFADSEVAIVDSGTTDVASSDTLATPPESALVAACTAIEGPRRVATSQGELQSLLVGRFRECPSPPTSGELVSHWSSVGVLVGSDHTFRLLVSDGGGGSKSSDVVGTWSAVDRMQIRVRFGEIEGWTGSVVFSADGNRMVVARADRGSSETYFVRVLP